MYGEHSKELISFKKSASVVNEMCWKCTKRTAVLRVLKNGSYFLKPITEIDFVKSVNTDQLFCKLICKIFRM